MVYERTPLRFRRGDYALLSDDTRLRIEKIGNVTAFVRHVHASRLLEWLHAHVESWVLWPLEDMGNAALRGLFG